MQPPCGPPPGMGAPCGMPPFMPQAPPPMMPMIPAMPPSRRRSPPPCSSNDGNARITAELATPFLEELNKLGDCKQITAEINGKTYNLKLHCPKSKKRKKRSHSDSSSSSGHSSKRKNNGGSGGGKPCVKLCDCNLPVPPELCQDSDSDNRLRDKEDKINKNLSLCLQMMREFFAKNFDRQEAEDDAAVQMVEIPVMVVRPDSMGGMPGMGMGGMPGMGMMGGMPGMGMGGMPGMGMGGMPGMGMGGMPGMGMGGMPGMGMMADPCSQRKKSSPCDPCSDAKGKKIVCKTDRDQQCDESALADKKDDAGDKKKEGKGGGKGKGDKKGKKK